MSRMRRSSMSSSGETTISVRVSIRQPVDAVPAVKFRASFGENRFVRFGRPPRRLRGVGPERATGRIADVAEAAPMVARRVLLPARDGDVLPPAVAAAGAGDEHVVATVRQQLHFGHWRIGTADDANRWRARIRRPHASPAARQDARGRLSTAGCARAAASAWPGTAGPPRTVSGRGDRAAGPRTTAGSCPGGATCTSGRSPSTGRAVSATACNRRPRACRTARARLRPRVAAGCRTRPRARPSARVPTRTAQ